MTLAAANTLSLLHTASMLPSLPETALQNFKGTGKQPRAVKKTLKSTKALVETKYVIRARVQTGNAIDDYRFITSASFHGQLLSARLFGFIFTF